MLYHFWPHPASKLSNNSKVYSISSHFLTANHIKDQPEILQQSHVQTIDIKLAPNLAQDTSR